MHAAYYLVVNASSQGRKAVESQRTQSQKYRLPRLEHLQPKPTYRQNNPAIFQFTLEYGEVEYMSTKSEPSRIVVESRFRRNAPAMRCSEDFIDIADGNTLRRALATFCCGGTGLNCERGLCTKCD
jgi:hypothetical protein